MSTLKNHCETNNYHQMSSLVIINTMYPPVAIPLIQLSQFSSTSQTAEALLVLHHSIQIVQHCRTTFAGARHEKQSKTINRYEKR
jgi:hypothetical protein